MPLKVLPAAHAFPSCLGLSIFNVHLATAWLRLSDAARVPPLPVPRARPLVLAGAAALSLFLGGAGAADKPAPPAAPTLDHFYPVAATRGASTPLTALGKFNPWPPEVWTDAPGIVFRAGEQAGQFTVDVAPEVAPGPHLIRFHNDRGASAPRFLIVTPEPLVLQTEPNDDHARAPSAPPLPVTLEGRLDKAGDVDCLAVTLEAGQTLVAALDAYVLGSPVDAVLRLVDARGREVALNHDNGRNPDPALTWTAPAAGRYVLQVFGFAHPATADVRFTGSATCVYRLHLATGAPPPPAFAALALPEWSEAEHAARTGDDAAPAAPFAVTGTIGRIGEEDRFRFATARDEKVVVALQAAALGLPLDGWIAIRDAAGKELARNDDGAGFGSDPLLEWTAPAAGTYVAVVGSVLQRAGPDHRYRLTFRPPEPRFTGAIAESGFTLAAGKSVSVKLTARRIQGFTTPLTAAAVGLPPGVTAPPVALDGKAKDVTLELTAAADAPAASVPFQIELRAADDAPPFRAVHELTSTAQRNGVPQGFRDLVIVSTEQLWLTVLPSPEPPPATGK